MQMRTILRNGDTPDEVSSFKRDLESEDNLAVAWHGQLQKGGEGGIVVRTPLCPSQV